MKVRIMKKRILFLISDTGGGHRASAMAIAEAIQFLHPKRYEIVIKDILKNYSPTLFRKMPNAYRWLIGPGRPLWRLMWHMFTQPTLQRHILDNVTLLMKDYMRNYFRIMQPDLVVSVHPLLNQIGFNCIRNIEFSIPFVTVVTDLFNIHSTWIDPRVTRCIVPTETARDQAIRFGMAPEKIAVYGQPVSLKFAQPPEDKLVLRQKMDLDVQRPAILMTGGGEGSGRLLAIAHQIAQTIPHVQLLIVTGRNQSLRKDLEAMTWGVPVHVYGFIKNMHELMYAADLIITKAGPSTISEALIAKLPIILSDFIPPQETSNVNYIERNGVGVFARNPADIARLIDEWTRLGNSPSATFRSNAERMIRPYASLLIAEDLCHLVEYGIGRSKHLRVISGQNADTWFELKF